MGRIERIRHALNAGGEIGSIDGYYCQSGMPGRRWVVWGRAVGAFEYGGAGTAPLACERAYSTREVEHMLRVTGLLGC